VFSVLFGITVSWSSERLIYTDNILSVMPLITVSDYVKDKLEEIKEREEHKSMDSVIRSLGLKGGYKW